MTHHIIRKPAALLLGSAFALAGTTAHASMFQASELASGYMVAAAGDMKAAEATCGENNEPAKDKAAEGKCGEGKCGEGKCGTDGKPAADAMAGTDATAAKSGTDKAGDASCGGDKKSSEASCGGNQ